MVDSTFFDDLDFRPGNDSANYIEPHDLATVVAMVLTARDGTVFDEINVSPLKRVIQFGHAKPN